MEGKGRGARTAMHGLRVKRWVWMLTWIWMALLRAVHLHVAVVGGTCVGLVRLWGWRDIVCSALHMGTKDLTSVGGWFVDSYRVGVLLLLL
jgi:hypothetical protein